MKNNINIYETNPDNEIEEVRSLFLEYANSLNFDLCFQRFDEELKSLPGKYSPPGGLILLAKVNDKYAGCVALRDSGDSICEMKRLYVRPEFRGLGIGKSLCDNLIEKSRQIGYKKMRLDTIAEKMQSAIKLYKSYGFYEIPAYYHNPEKGVIYMEMIL